MLNVVSFPKFDADDIVQGLRNLANDIEAGEYTPDMAVIVLASSGERMTAEGRVSNVGWSTFGLGAKASNLFAVKGALFSAAHSFDGGGNA